MNYILQVFSAANVIFAGVGVFVSARIMLISLCESFSRFEIL